MNYFLRFTNILIFICGFAYLTKCQDIITASEIQEHINFLASDSLKGRKPGTSESKIAAQYILDEFSQSGLKKLGKDGFQYFEIKSGLKVGTNSLSINGNNLEFKKDFTILPYSESIISNSDVIFVGYGFNITEEKLKWTDYQDIDVKGKWVLILRGHPELDQRSSVFETYADDRAKVLTAKDKGAIGVLLVSTVKLDEKDELIPLQMGRSDMKSGLPVLQIKRNAANLLLGKTPNKIEDLEKSINEKRLANSFNCNTEITVKTEIDFQIVKVQNVVALLEGSDPKLKKEFIIVGAHYDHLGFGGKESGSRMPDTVAIHNGADDNASGVASIIEIAEYLSSIKKKLKRSVLFIAFDGEEEGLLGSQYFTSNPLIDIKQVVAMLNFDMVGRMNEKTKELSISGTGTSLEWEKMLDSLQQKSDMKFAYSKEGFGASDHSSFYAMNTPVLFFNSGLHEDYHTPGDDSQLINSKGEEEISKLGTQILIQLATQKTKPTFQEAGPKTRTSGRTGLKVKLGIMPGFASSDNNGLKVEGVIKDGIAEKAGILKGDLIISINGEKILNIYDYMERLKKYKPGDRVSIDVMRGEEKKIFLVDL